MQGKIICIVYYIPPHEEYAYVDFTTAYPLPFSHASNKLPKEWIFIYWRIKAPKL